MIKLINISPRTIIAITQIQYSDRTDLRFKKPLTLAVKKTSSGLVCVKDKRFGLYACAESADDLAVATQSQLCMLWKNYGKWKPQANNSPHYILHKALVENIQEV